MPRGNIKVDQEYEFLGKCSHSKTCGRMYYNICLQWCKKEKPFQFSSLWHQVLRSLREWNTNLSKHSASNFRKPRNNLNLHDLVHRNQSILHSNRKWCQSVGTWPTFHFVSNLTPDMNLAGASKTCPKWRGPNYLRIYFASDWQKLSTSTKSSTRSDKY